MTSEELVGLLQGEYNYGGRSIDVKTDEVYFAARLAQKNILGQVRLLEARVNLSLVANKDTYQFPIRSISAVSDDGNGALQITDTGHPFNTGDLLYVDRLTGFSGWFNITKVDDDNYSLDGSTYTTVTVVVTARVYHALYAMVSVKPGTFVNLSSGNPLSEEYEAGVYRDGNVFLAQSPNDVHRFALQATDPPTIIVQGIPSIAINTKLTIYRRPYPFENVSAAVDPIIPGDYENLLLTGTRYFILLNRKDARLSKDIAELSRLFEVEKGNARRILAKLRRVEKARGGGLEV